jgi:hypothetical protein
MELHTSALIRKGRSSVVGISNRHMGHRGNSVRNNILLLSTDSTDSSPKAESQEQRSPTLYTFASRLQKQKARFNPYMVACNFTGYFTPSAMWPSSHLDSLSFISLLCHPSPNSPATTLSRHTLLASFLTLLLATLSSSFDAWTHPGSKSIILIQEFIFP